MNNLTAVAEFHSLKGEKSALVLVKRHAFEYDATPAYVPRTSAAFMFDVPIDQLGDEHKGLMVNIPDNYAFKPMVSKDGEVRTTDPKKHKDGKVFELKQLTFSPVTQ